MLTLAAWLHDIDPYFIKLWEGGPIRWYGLSYLAGFTLAYLVILRLTKIGRSPLTPRQVSDFIFIGAIGTVVGGRLGYVFFYDIHLLGFTGEPPFWGVLAINHGGMASHGGIIGMVLACLWFARKHRLNALHLMDLVAFTAPLGVVFGRIANFINGELYGRACDASFALAVKFPQELFEDVTMASKLPMSPAEAVRGVQLGDARTIELVEPLLTPRHPSQLYAALAEGLLVFLVLAAVWHKPKRHGVILGACLVCYAVGRITDEFFRQPDAHLGLQAMGLTRGQWLTTLVLLAGAAVLAWRLRSGEKPQGSSAQ